MFFINRFEKKKNSQGWKTKQVILAEKKKPWADTRASCTKGCADVFGKGLSESSLSCREKQLKR